MCKNKNLIFLTISSKIESLIFCWVVIAILTVYSTQFFTVLFYTVFVCLLFFIMEFLSLKNLPQNSYPKAFTSSGQEIDFSEDFMKECFRERFWIVLPETPYPIKNWLKRICKDYTTQAQKDYVRIWFYNLFVVGMENNINVFGTSLFVKKLFEEVSLLPEANQEVFYDALSFFERTYYRDYLDMYSCKKNISYCN